MADGSDPEGARIVVRSTATGFVVETGVRRGRFLVQGLETGGPYTITVRRIRALARKWEGVYLALGEPLELDVRLEPAPVQLDSVVVEAAGALSSRHGGTAATLGDSLVHRLPSLNRDIYEFLRLVPQISARIGFTSPGISGGGVGFRFNHFLTNGVSERSLSGNQPPEFAGSKSVPFEAVREYQVLVAPFDVRYGDFAGAMVNTVTRSGTNRFAGTAFAQGRGDVLARADSTLPPYERWQYGFSLSGPLLRDRAHFLVATEFMHLTSPPVGPFVGQSDAAMKPVPVAQGDLAELQRIFGQYGMVAGTGGVVLTRERQLNLFVRVDAALPELSSRALLWLNEADGRNRSFSRADAPEIFALSSYVADQKSDPRTVALQLFTTLSRRSGGHNEFSLSRRINSLRSVPEVEQPVVQVTVPRSDANGLTTLLAGTPETAQSGGFHGWNVNLRDDFTLPLGSAHEANLGFEAEWFHLVAAGLQNAYGTWTFSSLDSLERGEAERFELARDFGSAARPITGGQFGLFAGDYWRLGKRVFLTLGLRADLLTVNERAPYSRLVDSLFGRRTDARFHRRVELSPRIGFTWDLSATARHQIRGGLGVFTGRPPLAWLHLPLQRYGVGTGALLCGVQWGDLGLPPSFEPDPHNPPLACVGGAGLANPPAGDVELIDPELRLTRVLRGVLAYERRLPGNVIGTLEALVTRNLSDFLFVNRNLAGPQSTDRIGRVLYGSFDAQGRSRPVRITDSLPSVIELRNVSRGHGVQLAASMAKEFVNGFSMMASYTWSRVRDVSTPLRVNNPGGVNWAARAVSGRHDDLDPGISLNDVPHRVALAATWRAPWGGRWATELSALYVGESGSPFTYRAFGVGGRGDLNADGGPNDPVYVPSNALDPAEIVFTGLASAAGSDNSPEAQAARVAAQRTAFEQFIARTPCLTRRRGRILERNGCREPWAQYTALSLRQLVPLAKQTLEAQLDVFNPLNLLDGDWGRRRTATASLLEHVSQAPGPTGQSEPVFRLNETATRWTTLAAESAFQLQFGLRYRF